MTEKYADNLFKIAMNLYLEKNNIMGLVSLFYGIGAYTVEAFPNAGHDYYSVLRAMYKYNSNNKINMEEIFSKILDEMIEIKVTVGLQSIVDFLLARLVEVGHFLFDVFGHNLRI